MKINEIIKNLNSYLLVVRTKCGKSVKTVIYAISASDARLIANDIWGAKNVQSVTQITDNTSESFQIETQSPIHTSINPIKAHQIQRSAPKIIPTRQKHEQNIRKLTNAFLTKMQHPKPNENDIKVAMNRAKQIQKLADLSK